MLINCFGSRGSTPVYGKEYLKYGGDTTSMEIRTKDNHVVIVDAGSGIRRLGNKLLKEGVKKIDILFTHFHWDHILGFPFFKPVFFSDFNISIHACSFNEKAVKEVIAQIMKHPYFPVELDQCPAEIVFNENCKNPYRINSIRVEQIAISHPNQGLGYKFIEDGKSFVFIPDNELSYLHPGGLKYEDYVEFCRGADLLIHDAEYSREEYETKTTWGHSVYLDTLNLALDAQVKKFGIFHLNQERGDAEIDNIVKHCRQVISERKSDLECFAVSSYFQTEL